VWHHVQELGLQVFPFIFFKKKNIYWKCSMLWESEGISILSWLWLLKDRMSIQFISSIFWYNLLVRKYR
jgi:hypothetical protein